MSVAHRPLMRLSSDGWGVFDSRDADECVHVYPVFGRQHFASIACWCEPVQDGEVEGPPYVVVHNQEH